MDKELRQRADAGGIEKLHGAHIKNQLGRALRTHGLKKTVDRLQTEPSMQLDDC
jgi:hypothetical protein